MTVIRRFRQRGFSLVEIMVGLAIGMLAVIVILQVLSLSESRTRTSTSGGDALSNGAIAFYKLQRDVGQAGYGMAAADLFNCQLTWNVSSSGTAISSPPAMGPVTINPPTSIIPAGDINTDTVLIMYGSSNEQPQGNVLLSSSGNVHKVQMPTAFAIGDYVIAAPSLCSATLTLDRVTAKTTESVTTANSTVGNSLYNLGPTPFIRAYAIRGGNLTMCDYLQFDCSVEEDRNKPDVWVHVANNIVSMRALYWHDTSADFAGIVNAGGARNQTRPTTACEWARASAVSLVLVARSANREIEIVTNTAANAPAPVNAPTWAENATLPLVAATGTLGPGTAADEPWKHYRYKVFEAVIPLRNVVWMGRPQSC